MNSNKKKSILLGVTASLLFSVTFILNRSMSQHGASWIWSSSLRFYWMLPFFIVIVYCKGGLYELFEEIRKNLLYWLIWSTIGFGLFYAPLTFAAEYTPSWLLASTWQFTIIAGLMLTPFINQNIPSGKHNLLLSATFSGIILLGIIVMQVSHAKALSPQNILKGIVPVLLAAFAYPLGNRKMMQLVIGKLDVYQRILGMIICSLPFWLLLSGYEIVSRHSFPEKEQILQTFIVALISGVMATILFFSATDKVRSNEKSLAAVEATQSMEVLFALAGEILLLGIPLPDLYGVAGIFLVMLGMILHNYKG